MNGKIGCVVKPKDPYLKWARDIDPDATSDNAEEGVLYLIPWAGASSVEQAVMNAFPEIFRRELSAWCEAEKFWPSDLTFDLFVTWFSYEPYEIIEIIGES